MNTEQEVNSIPFDSIPEGEQQEIRATLEAIQGASEIPGGPEAIILAIEDQPAPAEDSPAREIYDAAQKFKKLFYRFGEGFLMAIPTFGLTFGIIGSLTPAFKTIPTTVGLNAGSAFMLQLSLTLAYGKQNPQENRVKEWNHLKNLGADMLTVRAPFMVGALGIQYIDNTLAAFISKKTGLNDAAALAVASLLRISLCGGVALLFSDALEKVRKLFARSNSTEVVTAEDGVVLTPEVEGEARTAMQKVRDRLVETTKAFMDVKTLNNMICDTAGLSLVAVVAPGSQPGVILGAAIGGWVVASGPAALLNRLTDLFVAQTRKNPELANVVSENVALSSSPSALEAAAIAALPPPAGADIVPITSAEAGPSKPPSDHAFFPESLLIENKPLVTQFRERNIDLGKVKMAGTGPKDDIFPGGCSLSGPMEDSAALENPVILVRKPGEDLPWGARFLDLERSKVINSRRLDELRATPGFSIKVHGGFKVKGKGAAVLGAASGSADKGTPVRRSTRR